MTPRTETPPGLATHSRGSRRARWHRRAEEVADPWCRLLAAFCFSVVLLVALLDWVHLTL